MSRGFLAAVTAACVAFATCALVLKSAQAEPVTVKSSRSNTSDRTGGGGGGAGGAAQDDDRQEQQIEHQRPDGRRRRRPGRRCSRQVDQSQQQPKQQ